MKKNKECVLQDSYIGGTWEWCLMPHREKDIRKKVLEDYNNICFAYLCKYSPMSEEFRHELAVLSLGHSEGSQDIRMVPYVNKDNIKEVFTPISETYDWVNGGFIGEPKTDGISAIGFPQKLSKSIESVNESIKSKQDSLKKYRYKYKYKKYPVNEMLNAARERTYLIKRYEKSKDATELISFYDEIMDDKIKYNEKLLESLLARREILISEKKALDSMMNGKVKQNEHLFKDLKDLFTDRLPERM